MQKIKFSVCIPNFNYAGFIDKTIQSVLDQDYHNFEIIVSDNCSTDDSEKVVLSISDSRIRFSRNNYNIGFSPNLDKATESAIGDYFILLSADDIMKKNALRILAEYIHQHVDANRELLLMAGADIINEDGKVVGKKNALTGDVIQYLKKNDPEFSLEKEYCIYNGHEILKALILGTFQPAGQFLATCYSSELYRKVEGYKTPMTVFPDAFFSHKILELNPKVIYINQSIFEYRIHGQNNYSGISNMIHIKNLTDTYLQTTMFSEQILKKIGLDSKTPKKTFIKNIILNTAFRSILKGQSMRAIRYLSFGISAYPKNIVKYHLFYLSIMLLLFSIPFSLLYKILKLIKVNEK